MISHEHRCLFVHIPKNAGNSVNRVFGFGWQDHKDLARYHAELPSTAFHDYFKFAVVRNPWDRLFSDYNYQLKKSRPNDSKLFLFDERGRQRSFSEWVESALGEPERYAPANWGGEVSPGIHRFSPQVDWISIDGVRRLDFVARLESLDQDFRVICRHLGMKRRRLPRRNGRFHFHYSRYYDSPTRERVARYYARDIATFRYEFEERTFSLAFSNWFSGRFPARVNVTDLGADLATPPSELNP